MNINPIISNYLLIIAGIYLLIMLWRGYVNGLVLELAKILTLVVTLILAYYIAGFLKDKINIYHTVSNEFSPDILNQFIIFVVSALIIYIILRAGRSYLKRINDIAVIGWLNAFGGMIIALFKSLIVIAIIITIICSPVFKNGNEIVDNSNLKFYKDEIRNHISSIDQLFNVFEQIESVRNGFDIDNIIGE